MGIRLFLPCLLVVVLGVLSRPAAADKHALLIGIDDYEQKDAITTLSAASADAEQLAVALREACGFLEKNVRVLTSRGELKPTRANILFELEQLSARVKPDDLVFVFYSGHGIDVKNDSYLLPYDTDVRTEFLLRSSAIKTSLFTESLGQIDADGLVLAFDMCRNDPFKGARSATAMAQLSEKQTRDLVLKPVREGKGPRASVTFFSCAVGERSWEWQVKKRGYFSYYLERALRTLPGSVRIGDLDSYLTEEVPQAVKREQGQKQTPWTKIEGIGATKLVLAQRPGGNVAAPAAPAGPAPGTPVVETVDATAKIKLTSTPAGAQVFIDDEEQPGKVTPCEIAVHLGVKSQRRVVVAVQATGFLAGVRQVTLQRGQIANIPFTLEKEPPRPVKATPANPEVPVTPGTAPQPGVTGGGETAVMAGEEINYAGHYRMFAPATNLPIDLRLEQKQGVVTGVMEDGVDRFDLKGYLMADGEYKGKAMGTMSSARFGWRYFYIQRQDDGRLAFAAIGMAADGSPDSTNVVPMYFPPAQGGTTSTTPTTPTNPVVTAAGADNWQGTFSNGLLTVQLRPAGNGKYTGMATILTIQYPLTATIRNGVLHGTYIEDDEEMEFTARLNGDTLTVVDDDDTTFQLQRQR